MNQTLAQMPDKQLCVVKKIDDKSALNRRLRDMGILPGVELFIEHRAPLGDPITIKITNFSLNLRINEAKKIIVEAK
jgi:ferrous iron transport protein A